MVDAFIISCACLANGYFAYQLLKATKRKIPRTDGTLPKPQPKPTATHKPVNIGLLEAGDTIVLRSGIRREVVDVRVIEYFFHVATTDGMFWDYEWNGRSSPAMTTKLSDFDIVKIIKKKEPKMVDLSILEVGDTVTRRDGKELLVEDIHFSNDKQYPVHLISDVTHRYTMDGKYFVSRNYDSRDIVKITKKGHDMVDLSKAKKGDIVVLRCGLTDTIASIGERTRNDSGPIDFVVSLLRGRFNFMKDGIWIEGEENEMDVVHIISNPHNKTLSEIIEDGAKVERQKPMKFLFKGEKEPRELKVGDRLIYDSGSLYEVRKVDINGIVKVVSVRAGNPLIFNMANLLTSEDFLFVHASDKVVRHKEGDYGILKYKTADQYVVDTVEGLQIWPRDICTLI